VSDCGSDKPVLQCETESTGRLANRTVKELGAVRREDQVCQAARTVSTPFVVGRWFEPKLACRPAAVPAPRYGARTSAGSSKSTGRLANRTVKDLGSQGGSPVRERKNEHIPRERGASSPGEPRRPGGPKRDRGAR
jgi:hypothetical protein